MAAAFRAMGLVASVSALVAACARVDSPADRSSLTSASPASTTGSRAPTVPVPSGEAVPTSPGEVTVTVSAARYRVGGVVSAIIANGLATAIYTQDAKTDCTIAFLQRRNGDAWTDVSACALGRPPATVTIGPSLGRRVSFDPSSAHFAATTGRGGLDVGAYRVRFSYRSTPGEDAVEPLVAYSEVFRIG